MKLQTFDEATRGQKDFELYRAFRKGFLPSIVMLTKNSKTGKLFWRTIEESKGWRGVL